MNVNLSIIVPVYNGGNYISRCINSLLKQTYRFFEIIVVNDGSCDNTEEILNTYLKNNSSDISIKVISIVNSGVSKARNIGLEHVMGKYVMFIDSDDFVND